MYNLVTRLVALRDVLRTSEPVAFGDVARALPTHYEESAAGRRQFRRDLDALEGLGWPVERQRARETRYRVRSLVLGGQAALVEEAG